MEVLAVKNRIIVLCLVLCLLLSGCMSWMDGRYSSVKPHQFPENQTENGAVEASGYPELCEILAELVESGVQNMLIHVGKMNQNSVSSEMNRAVQYILENHPVGAYAVSEISYELGTSGTQPALAVTVAYNQRWDALRSIKNANGMEAVQSLLEEALNQCEPKVVMRVEQYQTMDFDQFVSNYMQKSPQNVIEMPQLTVNTYPETGTDRVVEITFTYQNNREDLRIMQNRVRPLLISAELYVSGNNSAYDKYALLYAFLMERHEYEIETSITPAYSLLIHGVGDSRAFATVFAAMCIRADLECKIVSGTRSGEPHFWNMICVDGTYFHLDLLESDTNASFQIRSDEEMNGYVWDYSSYPRCGKE